MFPLHSNTKIFINEVDESGAVHLWLYTTHLFPEQTLEFVLCLLFLIVLLQVVDYVPLDGYFRVKNNRIMVKLIMYDGRSTLIIFGYMYYVFPALVTCLF